MPTADGGLPRAHSLVFVLQKAGRAIPRTPERAASAIHTHAKDCVQGGHGAMQVVSFQRHYFDEAGTLIIAGVTPPGRPLL